MALLFSILSFTVFEVAAQAPSPTLDATTAGMAKRYGKPGTSVIVETTPLRHGSVVHTRTSHRPEINDAQLLAMFADQPAGILTGPGGKEFVLFEPRD